MTVNVVLGFENSGHSFFPQKYNLAYFFANVLYRKIYQNSDTINSREDYIGQTSSRLECANKCYPNFDVYTLKNCREPSGMKQDFLWTVLSRFIFFAPELHSWVENQNFEF